MNSTQLIGNPEERYKQLERKNFDWCSFYNGWIEGRAALLVELEDKKTTVHNPVTGKDYVIRKRSAVNPDAKEIRGLWHEDKP